MKCMKCSKKSSVQNQYIYQTNQVHNYRKTLRENDDMLDRFGWSSQDRLKGYIDSL